MSLRISSPPNTRREQIGKPTRLERQGKVARCAEEGLGREALAFWPDYHGYSVLGNNADKVAEDNTDLLSQFCK